MTNGYIVLTKGEPNLYKHAVEAINLGKPIYFVDAENKAIYFGTKIALEDADVVIDAGKYTVTIEADNDVLVTTSIDLSIIEDSKGNKRFIEGDGTGIAAEGWDITYCKWSLSGTHFMCVLAGSIANDTVVATELALANFNIPAWILNKIFKVWGTNNIELKNITLIASNWSTQSLQVCLSKETDGIRIATKLGSSLTLTADRSFRVQFDLLIDNE